MATRSILLFLLLSLPVSLSFVTSRTRGISSSSQRTTILPGTAASNLDDAVLDSILETAVDASKAAASIIRENADGSAVVEKKSTTRDLLTLIDPLCEKAIREKVVENFPDHGILGEEEVKPGIQASIDALEAKLLDSDWLWIIDPIDGTTNFASGIPINMPSIAVAYKGEVMVAVLNDPHRDELFTAVRGRGARLNGDRIHVGLQETLGEAVVGMESPAGEGSLQQCLQGIEPLMKSVRTVRMLGSSAVFLPWVANGRLTAYWTPDECAWDIAAGSLMVQEAGGKCTDILGNEYNLRTRNLIASNGKIHDSLLTVLREDASLSPLV
ncbi:unnamed protein product [Cylindrotheca closterium]|uniref:Inositol-1-monophosphatase n=1 Tax=Cylindrotheca closterium TaxID=2856 RepID=A0AAD2G374_9STRA|nr:unnamed protein product [Cylindrotheca closterium]